MLFFITISNYHIIIIYLLHSISILKTLLAWHEKANTCSKTFSKTIANAFNEIEYYANKIQTLTMFQWKDKQLIKFGYQLINLCFQFCVTLASSPGKFVH